MRKMTYGIWLIIFIFIASMVFAGTGCKTTATTETTAAETTAAETTAAETTAAEPVTLLVWDSHTNEEQNAGMQKIVDNFMTEHPNIIIDRQPLPPGDVYVAVLKASLDANVGPDIFAADTSSFFMAPDYYLPLDDAYAENDWDSRFFTWAKEREIFNGTTYGIAAESEYYAVWYNKSIFEELGLSVPTTYEEFIQACETIKAAGYIPVAFGDGDQWPAFHTFSIMANNTAGKEKLDNVLFGNGTWDDPDFIKAIQLFFVDMNQAGYFMPEAVSASFADATSAFYTGSAAMIMTGSWLESSIEANVTDFEAGIFFFPSIDGKPVLPPAGIGGSYSANAKTAHPEEVIEYLDYLLSPESVQIWMEEMATVPPVNVANVGDFNLSPLMKTIVETLAEVSMGYSIDVIAHANFNTAQLTGYQQVMMGEKTPEQMVKDLQAAWEADKAASTAEE